MTRVCDRCIQRKVKCDLRRPTCSRCNEAGLECIYSSARRKPGPAKGSRRRAGNHRISRSKVQKGVTDSRSSINVEWAPVASWEGILPSQELQQQPSFASNHIALSAPVEFSGHFTPVQRDELINSFFSLFHPSIPLFDQARFLRQYGGGAVSLSLLETILVITAKVRGIPVLDKQLLDAEVGRLLAINSFEDDEARHIPLDRFQQAALLAYFSYYQRPGQASWLRIGELTRKAYQYGLHQLDGGTTQDSPLTNYDPEELDEWRRLFWCIYCLDSYSNITVAAPFIVETEGILTALPVGQHILLAKSTLSLPTHEQTNSESLIFLSPETGDLWQTTKNIMTSENPVHRNFNMNIVTTSLIRETAISRRLQSQNPRMRLHTRRLALGDHISAVRLALPARYLNPARNTLENESNAEHHTRFVIPAHMFLRVPSSFCLSSRSNHRRIIPLEGYRLIDGYATDWFLSYTLIYPVYWQSSRLILTKRPGSIAGSIISNSARVSFAWRNIGTASK